MKATPAIITKKEDISALVLYWLRIQKPSTLANGFNWLGVFSQEFYK